MEKRTSARISISARKVFTDIARQFEVNNREMHLVELFDKLAAKKAELLKLVSK